jgi:5'-methylthioadenosine phosphorylase
MGNADEARALLQNTIPLLSNDEAAAVCPCQTALEFAIITPPESRDAKLVSELSAVAGRVLKNP